jgi:DNA-binding response OmpR family regulator
MAPGRQILVLAPPDQRHLCIPLRSQGFIVSFFEEIPSLENLPHSETPDVLIMDLSLLPQEEQSPFIDHCIGSSIPVIGIVPEGNASSLDPNLKVVDFLFSPFQEKELQTRVHRAMWNTQTSEQNNIITRGELLIDQDRYEVFVSRRKILLTFKEFQLICLMATNPGRVYSREELLSLVWEYDYFGGTRTVDVHIRRLRSKLEDSSHIFIETVRNVGYRFYN